MGLHLMLLMLYANSTLASEGHGDENEHEAVDHCETPTEEITINGGTGGAIVYDKNEYHVPKNACIELIFVNEAIIPHDLSIDEIHDELEKVHIHLENNTDGHDSDGKMSMHILTPDQDTEYEIYCSVEGHKEAGMIATLIVGEGLPDDEGFLPGFEFISFIFATIAMSVIIKKRK